MQRHSQAVCFSNRKVAKPLYLNRGAPGKGYVAFNTCDQAVRDGVQSQEFINEMLNLQICIMVHVMLRERSFSLNGLLWNSNSSGQT